MLTTAALQYKQKTTTCHFRPFADTPGWAGVSYKGDTYWNSHLIFMSHMSFLPLNL